MKINFSNFQQVNTQDNTPIVKWTPAEMQSFYGTYIGSKTIQYNGDTFTRLMFKEAVNNITGEAINGNLSCKDYAQLKLKLQGMEGKKIGVEWMGEHPHPKFPMKTMHTFGVVILPNIEETNDDLPF